MVSRRLTSLIAKTFLRGSLRRKPNTPRMRTKSNRGFGKVSDPTWQNKSRIEMQQNEIFTIKLATQLIKTLEVFSKLGSSIKLERANNTH